MSLTAPLVGAFLVALLASGCAIGAPSGTANQAANVQPPHATERPSQTGRPTTTRPAPQESERATASPAEQRANVDIGGRSLYLECLGVAASGRPTVILESGLGGSGIRSWDAVVDGLAPTFRVCTYDRAGVGHSDPPPTGRRTAADLAADLSALLVAADIAPPYLFVSHSIGPWVTTLFTVDHADQVVGLVLVDPRGPDVTQGWIDALPVETAGEPEALSYARAFVSVVADPSLNNERLDVRASEAQVRAALASPPAFGEMPLVVLRAARTPDEFPDLPPAQGAAWETAWFDGQRALAAASSAGRVVEVADSGHMVQLDMPRVLVDTVLEMAGGR